MTHNKKHNNRDKKGNTHHPVPPLPPKTDQPDKTISIIVKADTDGSREAVCAEIEKISAAIPIAVIHSGIGNINNSDAFLAATASRLVIGFAVDVNQHMQEIIEKSGVEIRIYTVIYRLLEDLRAIAASLIPQANTETITANAQVVALFKSTRKGIIMGCRVDRGKICVGDRFRVIGAMGPVYTGKIESLHIGRDTVQSVTAGQEVGIKISNFKKAAINDLIEIFVVESTKQPPPWKPQPRILRF